MWDISSNTTDAVVSPRDFAAVKDWHGKLSGAPGVAWLWGDLNEDGHIVWHVPEKASIGPRAIRWSDGEVTRLHSLERPFVLLDEEGIPGHLFCAASVGNPFVNASIAP